MTINSKAAVCIILPNAPLMTSSNNRCKKKRGRKKEAAQPQIGNVLKTSTWSKAIDEERWLTRKLQQMIRPCLGRMHEKSHMYNLCPQKMTVTERFTCIIHTLMLQIPKMPEVNRFLLFNTYRRN